MYQLHYSLKIIGAILNVETLLIFIFVFRIKFQKRITQSPSLSVLRMRVYNNLPFLFIPHQANSLFLIIRSTPPPAVGTPNSRGWQYYILKDVERGNVKAAFLQLIKLRGGHFRNLHFKGVRLGIILYTRSIFWRTRPPRFRTEIPEQVRQYIQQYVEKEWGW